MPLLLNTKFIDKAKSDDDLRYELAKANDCKISTIDRWLRENDVMLTTASNLAIIQKHYSISETAELLMETEPAQ